MLFFASRGVIFKIALLFSQQIISRKMCLSTIGRLVTQLKHTRQKDIGGEIFFIVLSKKKLYADHFSVLFVLSVFFPCFLRSAIRGRVKESGYRMKENKSFKLCFTTKVSFSLIFYKLCPNSNTLLSPEFFETEILVIYLRERESHYCIVIKALFSVVI